MPTGFKVSSDYLRINNYSLFLENGMGIKAGWDYLSALEEYLHKKD